MGLCISKPVVHGDKPGAQAYVTINPVIGKASQQPELKHLRSIPDANPTPSAYEPNALPTADDAEKHWLTVDSKQQYLDCATEVVDKYFDEKMPAPAASVTALVAGVLKVYRVVMDDLEGADLVEGNFNELWTTLAAALEAERKNSWAIKTVHELHVALTTALRPLSPPILEALEDLHHQTTRPTPDAKNRVRKAVAKRLALLAANIQKRPAELPEVGRVITERTIVTALAQPTNNFLLGPRVTTDSLVWYAFFTELPEQCSWKVFKQRFVEWPHWPQGVVQLIDALTLKDPNAAAWKTFCNNMQSEGMDDTGVWVHEINECFPTDLLGLQLVGALKRYFSIPGYKLLAGEAPQPPAALLARLLRDLDRTRRETNVSEGAEVLWALNERLWYTAGFVGPSVEEAVPSRALCVLEALVTKSQPQYLPAALLLAQLGQYIAFDRAHVQRVAGAARKIAGNTLTAADGHLMLGMALARAVLLAQGGFTWGAVLGSEQVEEWDVESNPLAPGLLFAQLATFLQRTTGRTWQELQEEDETIPVGMLRVHHNVRRLLLTTLWELTRFAELRTYFTDPLPALHPDRPAPGTLQQALLAVVPKGLGDEPSLAVAVLEQLPQSPTENMHTRPTSAKQAHGRQYSLAHSRQASVASRRSAQLHSRNGSMALTAEDLRAAAKQAVVSPTSNDAARQHHRTESGLSVGLATAERAAWRHQKDMMVDVLKANNGGVLPSDAHVMPPPSLVANRASNSAEKTRRTRTASGSRPPWSDDYSSPNNNNNEERHARMDSPDSDITPPTGKAAQWIAPPEGDAAVGSPMAKDFVNPTFVVEADTTVGEETA